MTASDGPAAAGQAFLRDVLDGLARRQKAIPAKYFYDTRGSQLFEEITALAEYYPTRTEFLILERHAADIASLIGPGAVLIEFGAGASRKIRTLLDALDRPAAFVPVDIAGEHLAAAATALAADYPDLTVVPVAGDYTGGLSLPVNGALASAKRVVFFPGSTIGNFTPEEARAFLADTRRLVRQGGEMIVGVDLQKDPEVLHAAYNDDSGVTAAFNLNLLERINRELGADFDLDAFRHHAFYDRARGRVEMHLVSEKEQLVRVGGASFRFAADETIHTENSFKYTVSGFQALAASAGFSAVQVWTDPRSLFSVHYLRAT